MTNLGSFDAARAIPQFPPTLTVEGPRGPVRIVRDRWGIAHIKAGNDLDLFFGQGFATATDRLWHLEWDRRRALGRSAELDGIPANLTNDAFARRARLASASRRGYDALDAETQAICAAHAEGINAFLASSPARPVELQVLDLEPEPWEGWHAVAVFVIRHVTFATWQGKLWRARVLAVMGEDAIDCFRLEGRTGDTPVIVPPGAREAVGALETAGLLAAGAEAVSGLDPLGLSQSGSNAWVVGGSRTASERPILAGDPHRPFETPNVYYQIHLVAPGIDAAGLSFPGVPGIPHFGQNEHVAWGVTNAMADYQDLYVERLPDAVIETHLERVEVRNGEAVEIECSVTRHGPIVVGGTEYGVGVALASTGLEAAGASISTVLAQLRASTVAELDSALAGWVEPANNLVMADRSGSIGYRTAGRIPIRTVVNSVLPVPGWTHEHDWTGVIADAELPRSHNPEVDAIVTANQRVTVREYGYLLNYDAYSSTRAQRIWDRLGDRRGPGVGDLEVGDHGAIHSDTVSVGAARFATLVSAVADDAGAFAGWDGSMDAGSPAAALYAVARHHLVVAVVATWPEELRANPFARWEPPATALSAAIRLSNSLDGLIAADDTTLLPPEATWASLALDAVEKARAELTERFGADSSAWSWGALHDVTPLHPLRGLDGFGELLRPTSGPLSGASGCVLATNQLSGLSTAAMSGSVARYIFDLADRGKSRWIVPLGASGHPASPHYRDQQDAWSAVETVPILTDWAEIESSAESTVDLVPG